jgi:hypothetical protein
MYPYRDRFLSMILPIHRAISCQAATLFAPLDPATHIIHRSRFIQPKEVGLNVRLAAWYFRGQTNGM